ncbi:GEVED domain-containing protein [Aquimarina spongiae]|uniref:GEVED domain-containing protein n=1 Tax=Aquimarina spongiae TaxID=570521 RepID=A0A1M6FNU6_9FLAO|nr:GEVED domain-containing protein [Aquimarina spongiae]SHI99362.1 hypothetical protein SAMN04488508_104386 [Aquimarina spongiae]
MLLKKIVCVAFLFVVAIGFSQKKETANATFFGQATSMIEVGPLSGKKLIPETPRKGEVNPKRMGANKIVPGKGRPINGEDPLLFKQKSMQGTRVGKAPSLTFEATSTNSAPSDPTGAIGPNHYVSARNSSFAIHDRSGNVLVPSTSLASIFPGETLGDPIVFYDSFADRFVITQFDGDPFNPEDPQNGFLVAVGQGPDPVNDGWFTYRFFTGTFPDYTKFSIWSDGYYITANKDQGNQSNSEVVYVIERDLMLQGREDARIVGFPLPGVRDFGFYSPASFNAIGSELPPEGDARVIYFQDDAWTGVAEDELKLWEINVDWNNIEQSTIAEAEELTVSSGAISAFDTTFDGGDFGNLPQPTGGSDIDALQGTVMYATNYRRFCDYNSVVLNFAIDIDSRQDTSGADIDNVAGIRWYELRQNGDGQPWTVFQEGTYTSPDGKSAWCGSMAMDIFGNIGMAYTTMGTVEDGATANSFASIRYTGRLATDPPGTMTITEQDIAIGTDIQRNGGNRYGDYAHLSVDPADDRTFWHIAEYFQATGNNARDVVGVFTVGDDVANDVGVVRVDSPNDATFTGLTTITISIKNFGTTAQSDIPVVYSVNGGADQTELFAGPLAPGETASFSFATQADFSTGDEFFINAETNLAGDSFPDNDCATKSVENLLANDVGIFELVSPTTTGQFTATQEITIIINNFGGTPQSNIPVFYTINGGTPVNEVFTGTIESLGSAEYTFTTTADLQAFDTYTFEIGTALTTDQQTANDVINRTIVNQLCAPTANCSQFGDGITSFVLSNVTNSPIACNTGYEDFTADFTIQLSRSVSTYTVSVQSGFGDPDGAERCSIWIDFNDNNIFEDSELILSNGFITAANTNIDFDIAIAEDAPLGRHLFRIRAGDVNVNNGAELNDACESMQFGSTHDYIAEITEEDVVEPNPEPIANTDLIVVTQPDNQFLITKVDSNAPEELRVYIFSITGQIVASNLVKRDASNRFEYTLDMSFARSGVYFARFGESKSSGDVAGFVVR